MERVCRTSAKVVEKGEKVGVREGEIGYRKEV